MNFAYLVVHLLNSKRHTWSEWPSGPASSTGSAEVKHGCVRSETGWATFQMSDQNGSLRHPYVELGVPCLDAAWVVGLN